MTKQCRGCGDWFIPDGKNREYCSQLCKEKPKNKEEMCGGCMEEPKEICMKCYGKNYTFGYKEGYNQAIDDFKKLIDNIDLDKLKERYDTIYKNRPQRDKSFFDEFILRELKKQLKEVENERKTKNRIRI